MALLGQLEYRVECYVNDGYVDSEVESFTLRINDENEEPTFKTPSWTLNQPDEGGVCIISYKKHISNILKLVYFLLNFVNWKRESIVPCNIHTLPYCLIRDICGLALILFQMTFSATHLNIIINLSELRLVGWSSFFGWALPPWRLSSFTGGRRPQVPLRLERATG